MKPLRYSKKKIDESLLVIFIILSNWKLRVLYFLYDLSITYQDLILKPWKVFCLKAFLIGLTPHKLSNLGLVQLNYYLILTNCLIW